MRKVTNDLLITSTYGVPLDLLRAACPKNFLGLRSITLQR